MELFEEPDRFLFIVHGPAQQWHHHVCADYLEAMRVQFAYEAQILARGYMLEGFDQMAPQPRLATSLGDWMPMPMPMLFLEDAPLIAH
ncbi:MAG TPA: hypothetical protein VL173_13525 [Vicinamibacterales bacterium]|jgi:hypothetical protein|nr:hypothetical protein [Vicinamibacterales bacterium]